MSETRARSPIRAWSTIWSRTGRRHSRASACGSAESGWTPHSGHVSLSFETRTGGDTVRMLRTLGTLAALVLVAPGASLGAATDPVATVTGGQIRGAIVSKEAVFKAI